MPRLSFSAEEILSAHFAPSPPQFAIRQNTSKGRKAEGIRYERRVQEHLCGRSDLYLPSPWIIFVSDDGKPRWCQPDGLELNYRTGVVTIVEVKYAHTAGSHRQLRKVYEPVIRRIFPRPSWGVRLVEVVKWFDPDTKYPEPIAMCDDPLNHKGPAIGVHVWRP